MLISWGREHRAPGLVLRAPSMAGTAEFKVLEKVTFPAMMFLDRSFSLYPLKG